MYVVELFLGIVVLHLNEAEAIPGIGSGPNPEMMEEWAVCELAWVCLCSVITAQMH
jgi:hypothetical protein